MRTYDRAIAVLNGLEDPQTGDHPSGTDLLSIIGELVKDLDHLERASKAAHEVRTNRVRSEWSAETKQFIAEAVLEPSLGYAVLVESFAKILRENAGPNYCEQSLEMDLASGVEHFSVVLVRHNGKGPHVLRREAEAALEELRCSTRTTVGHAISMIDHAQPSIARSALAELYDSLKGAP